MTWTKGDESLLQELQERKAAEMGVLRGCVVRSLHWYEPFSELTDVVEGLIANATTIRKVLEPFDEEANQ